MRPNKYEKNCLFVCLLNVQACLVKKKFSVNGSGMLRKKEKAPLAGKKKKKFMGRRERAKNLMESDVCY